MEHLISRPRSRVCLLCAVTVGLLIAGVACGAAGHVEGSSSTSSAVKAFPLSSELPSEEFVKLRGTFEGDQKTGTFLYRVSGRDRVCLKILVASPTSDGGVSVLSGTPSCKAIRAQSQRMTAAVGLSEPDLRLLAFGFGGGVARIEMSKPSGQVKTIGTKGLARSQAVDVGVDRSVFRYAVVRDVPPCFDHLRTKRKDESVVGATDLAPC